MKMKDKDKYWKKAKNEGYRARSSYKLKQINKRFEVIKKSERVLDIGAAPGGWLQVSKEIVGDGGKVVGVDLKKIKPIKNVKTIKGDITQKSTIDKIKQVEEEFDVIISDASPDLSGNWSVDHAKSIDLVRKTLDLLEELLKPRGNYLVKVFQGEMYHSFYEEVKNKFNFVKAHSPDASREQSAEIYVIGKDYRKKPIEKGETYQVEIVDKGKKGDGIAKIDDFVVFVPGAEKGEVLEVRITDIKDNYAKSKKT
ncbi:23S rRNA (uridine(2552)-2'-O)-methyltransferase [archaeon SCG-AAA382B04]|nr:23S rRNA (uridine(2552)-2'-O)-methyltransferase [archaeon SCG-AAA382B04]